MEVNAENERLIKQEYTRKAIIEAGYNPDAFLNYLSSVKTNGTDIDNWTLEDLKIEVQNFKKCYFAEEASEKNYQLTDSAIFGFATQNPHKSTDAKLEDGVEPSPEEVKAPIPDTQEEVKPQAEPTLQAENFSARIINVKIVDPGLFYRNYEMYGISSPLVKAVIYRKQDDFNFLKDNLARLYPGYAVPIMPKHHLKRLEPEALSKRKDELQFFLNKVIEHPLLSTSMLVWDFLTIESEQEYETAQANATKTPTPMKVTDCITLSGTIHTNYSDPLKYACCNIESGTRKVHNEIKKLEQYYKEFANTLDKQQNLLVSISSVYETIATVYVNTRVPELSEVFKALKKTILKTKDDVNDFADSLKASFEQSFSSYMKDLESLHELTTEWRNINKRYTSKAQKVKEEKESLFEQKKIELWKIRENCPHTVDVLFSDKAIAFTEMLPKETQEVAKMQEKLGFHSNILVDEFKRISAANNKQFRASLSRAVDERCRTFELLKLLWGSMKSYSPI